MTDADAATIVLRWFYDNQDKLGEWTSDHCLTPATFDGRFDTAQLHRLVRRLRDQGLILATCSDQLPFNPDFPIHPLGITTAGIDAIQLAPVVTDKDLRTRVLTYLYKHRDSDRRDRLKVEDLGHDHEKQFHRVIRDLRKNGLVELDTSEGGHIIDAEITSDGVDVIEGEAESPVALNQTFNLHGSVTGNVQIGNDNTQNVNVAVQLKSLAQAVVVADMPTEAKRTVLQRLHGIASDGTIGNAAGVASFIMEALKNLPDG